MDLGLAGAKAVVVGGSRGMGRAAARCFADDGARVAVVARSAGGLDRTVADLTGRGSPDAFGLTADITDEAAVNAAFDEIDRRWDGVANILVNAASGSVAGTFDTLSDADWRTAVDGGAMGMIRCVRAALPLLRRAEWARVVNFSASSSKRQTVSLVAYTAAKSMVTSVSKNLAQLLAPEEILVNGRWVSTATTPTGWPRRSPNTSGIRPTCRARACPTRWGRWWPFWPPNVTRT